jgi:hypothetical protein
VGGAITTSVLGSCEVNGMVKGEGGEIRTEFCGGEVVADFFDGGDGAVPAVGRLSASFLARR